MEYFKDDNIIGELPNWIEQSIRLGYLLAKNSKCEKHQILLISAPDESAIAPFIAIGVMRAAFEDPKANLCENYFDFLNICRENFNKETIKKNEIPWHVKRLNDEKVFYCFSSTDKNSLGLRLTGIKSGRGKASREPITSWIQESYACDWQINGLPIPQALSNDAINERIAYFLQRLPSCTDAMHEKNINSSYLDHVLIAPSASTQSKYLINLRNLGLSIDGGKISVSDLLKLDITDEYSTRRILFLGEREIKNYLFHKIPSIVIADGARAILNAWEIFQEGMIIGVINRCGAQDTLKEFIGVLEEKERFYKDIPTPIEYASQYIQIRAMEKVR